VPPQDSRKIDVQREIVAARRRIESIRGPLKSAFPVPDWATAGAAPGLSTMIRRVSHESSWSTRR
jgi:hypothetical protein